MVSDARYAPYGEERWANGETPTDFGFTSQRREGFELYDYNARYYSPWLGRFISPDTIVPEPASSGGFNRYRYTRNNPLRYTDPSGHCEFDAKGNISRFDCSLEEFDEMPIENRLRWTSQFMEQVPSAKDWFNNVEGIIEGFVDYGLSDSGSWISVVDASILEGIQDGYALSDPFVKEKSFITNSGSAAWQNFFTGLGSDASESELISLWGTAEAAVTAHGVSVARSTCLPPY